LIHSKEGFATDLIPDLALTLLTMTTPYAPAIAAQMGPRLTQRVLTKFFLPKFNGTASGTLFTNEGRIIPFKSGAAQPNYLNYPAAKHVEGKAAIWIRENNSSGGTLFHNHPGGTCGFCARQTETLLPNGAYMRIVPPEDAVAVKQLSQTEMKPYLGNSKIPKTPQPER
jgi:nucleic acid/nucleotide deaminase of polymorphic system toxin